VLLKPQKNKWLYVLFGIVFIILLFPKFPEQPLENRAISVGEGYDVKIQGEINLKEITKNIYDFSPEGVRSDSYTNEGSTIGKAQQEEEAVTDKKILNGLQRIFIVGEDQAKLGIHYIIQTLYRNSDRNDGGNMVICKNSARSVLEKKLIENKSPSDFVENMIKDSHNYNFFSSDYSLNRIYNEMESEGRTTVLPYITTYEEGIKTIGVACFKGDKLNLILDMAEARNLNMLSENKSKGIFAIKDHSGKAVEFDAVVKKKVKCSREKDKYKFIISLDVKGDIVSNNLQLDMISNKNAMNAFEKAMEDNIKKDCEGFVEKMQKEYSEDLLGLGYYAAARYGRRSGVDWDDIICNSTIEIKVKVKVDKQGRGSF